MIKTLTAITLSLSLAFTSVTATPAHAELSDDEAVGIIALLLFGAAIAASNNTNDDRADTVRDRGHRPERRGDASWREIPAQCLTTVTTRRGDQVRMFGRRCLNNNYRFVNRLPERCEISVRGRNNMRHGYVPRCLRNEGFWMEGRRRN